MRIEQILQRLGAPSCTESRERNKRRFTRWRPS